MTYRTGRRNGHTIYLQACEEPGDDDVFVGSARTAHLACELVTAANRGQPTDEPTEADPPEYEEATDLRAVLVGLIQAIDGVARGEWGIDDIKSDRAAAERSLVGGRSAAPTRDQVGECPHARAKALLAVGVAAEPNEEAGDA